MQTKTYNGVEFLTLEITVEGLKGIIAYEKLNSMYTIGFVIYNVYNEYDYDILKDVTPVIKSAEFSSSSNGIKADFNKNINLSIEHF